MASPAACIARPTRSRQTELCLHVQIDVLAWQLIRDLARASGLPSALFNITRLAPGSVIADFVVHADCSVQTMSLPPPFPPLARVPSLPLVSLAQGAAPWPAQVARNLEEQAKDPQSLLLSGNLTCHVER